MWELGKSILAYRGKGGKYIFQVGVGEGTFFDRHIAPWLKLNKLVVTLRSFVLVLNNTEPFSIDAESHTELV